jgi:hypothetical protein
MATQTTIPRYRPEQAYQKAARHGFKFTTGQEKFGRIRETREAYIGEQEMSNKIKAQWIILTFLVIFVAVGLGIFEAVMAQQTIRALTGGMINLFGLSMIGIALAIIGMAIGEGLSMNITTDELTGRREYNGKFYACVIFAILYIGVQFFITKTVSHTESTKYLPYLAVGIAAFELFFGSLFLGKAFAYIVIFCYFLQMAFTSRRIHKSAERCYNHMRDVEILSNAWNRQNPEEPPISFVRNDNICKTLAYYTGNKQYLNPIQSQDDQTNLTDNPDDSLTENDVANFVNNDNSADNSRY